MSDSRVLGQHVAGTWLLVEKLAGLIDDLGTGVKRKPQSNYKPQRGEVHGKDLFLTPDYGTDTIVPFLSPGWVIWESAAGKEPTKMADRLEHHNMRCIRSDLRTGQDRETWLPDEPFDAEVTNPPFSGKEMFITLACQQGHPFAFLVPDTTISAKWFKALTKMYRDIEFVSPDGRIDFVPPFKEEWESSSQINTLWITRGLGIGRWWTDVPLSKPSKRGMPKKAKTEKPSVELPDDTVRLAFQLAGLEWIDDDRQST